MLQSLPPPLPFSCLHGPVPEELSLLTSTVWGPVTLPRPSRSVTLALDRIFLYALFSRISSLRFASMKCVQVWGGSCSDGCHLQPGQCSGVVGALKLKGAVDAGGVEPAFAQLLGEDIIFAFSPHLPFTFGLRHQPSHACNL